MKKQRNKCTGEIVRMIIRGSAGNKRFTRRSIAKKYPELKELVKVL